jgi:hypothetical protein
MKRKKITVLTGAGVSAESGISTFRDSDGLWENYKVEDVASIEGWYRNPALVLDFYNARRAQLAAVKPNAAHIAIADLEKDYDVTVIKRCTVSEISVIANSIYCSFCKSFTISFFYFFISRFKHILTFYLTR